MNTQWWQNLQDHKLDYETFCRLQNEIEALVRQVTDAWLFKMNDELIFKEKVEPIIERLFHNLHKVYDTPEAWSVSADILCTEIRSLAPVILSDIEAALANDPATQDPIEVLFAYPGFQAIRFYRIAHAFHSHGVPLLPRLISERAHSLTGIDIHPGAQIGEAFFIDHGTGVVIGETAIIGRGVTLYQGVTLGAKRFTRDASGVLIKGQARHPIIQDGVTVYAGATILGRITVGTGSVVGGNVWLTESVPPNSRVTQQRYLASSFIDGDGI